MESVIKCIEVPPGGEVRVRCPFSDFSSSKHIIRRLKLAENSIHHLYAPPTPELSFLLSYSHPGKGKDSHGNYPTTTHKPIALSFGAILYEDERYYQPAERCSVKISNISDNRSIFVYFLIVIPTRFQKPWISHIQNTILSRFEFSVMTSSSDLDIVLPIFSHLCHSQELKTDTNLSTAYPKVWSNVYIDFMGPYMKHNATEKILIIGDSQQPLHELARTMVNLYHKSGTENVNLVDLDPSYTAVWNLKHPSHTSGCSLEFFKHCLCACNLSTGSASTNSADHDKDEIHLFCGSGAIQDNPLFYDHSVYHLSRLLKSRNKNLYKRKSRREGHNDKKEAPSCIVFPFEPVSFVEECSSHEDNSFSFHYEDIDSFEKRFCSIVKWFEISTVLFVGSDMCLHLFLLALSRYFPKPSPPFFSFTGTSTHKFVEEPFSFAIGNRSTNIFSIRSLPACPSQPVCEARLEKDSQFNQKEGNFTDEEILRDFLERFARHPCEAHHVEKNSSPSSTIEHQYNDHESHAIKNYMYRKCPQRCEIAEQLKGNLEMLEGPLSCPVYKVYWQDIHMHFVQLTPQAECDLSKKCDSDFRDFVLPFVDQAESTTSKVFKRDMPSLQVQRATMENRLPTFQQAVAIFRNTGMSTADDQGVYNLSNDIAGWGLALSQNETSEILFQTPLKPPLFDGNYVCLIL